MLLTWLLLPCAQGGVLPVVGATPATGRRLRACVGGAALAAPTPGVAAAPRVPQAGEVFFSANGASSRIDLRVFKLKPALIDSPYCSYCIIGSPLGAFVEDADAVPSTPLGPLQSSAAHGSGLGGEEAAVLARVAAAAAAAPGGGADAENPLAALAPRQITAVQQYISKLLSNLNGGAAAPAATH